MNNIEYEQSDARISLSQLKDYATDGNNDLIETAVIGSIGEFANKLFLLTYNDIVLAENPDHTWDYGPDTTIRFNRFVDIKIMVEEK